MKKALFILFIFVSLGSFGQILVPKKDYVPEIRKSRYTFAISLMSSGNSGMVSFGIMRENPDSTREVIFLTQDAFIRQASGGEVSRANPTKINFFEEYGIHQKVLGELWKLKHDKIPWEKKNELGWGTELGVPSKGQYEMLKEFGITRKADYSFGTDVWQMLIKVSDPVWVGRYQSHR